MTTTEAPATVLVDELVEGTRVLYPAQGPTGATTLEPMTVARAIDYPATRVLYFAEGGFGVADRTVELELAPRPLLEVLAEHVAAVQAAR